MTRSAPDWFGPPDPWLEGEFLAELAICERILARRMIDAAFLASFDRAVRDGFRRQKALQP